MYLLDERSEQARQAQAAGLTRVALEFVVGAILGLLTGIPFWAAMAAGYALLYVPIVSMIVYSFSASRMATVSGKRTAEFVS